MRAHEYRRETEAVRGGTARSKKNGPLSTPIYQTSTFEVVDNNQQVRATSTDTFYTRYGNPTSTVVENAIAELEGTEASLLFASGMAAVTTSILALVKRGDHVVAQRDIYGGVNKFLVQWLPKLGVETTLVDTIEYEQHQKAIRDNTKLLYLESPTNPTLRIVDLARAAAIARRHNLISIIDNTFATPMNVRPAEFGIDLVMHSATKYLGGHSDLIAGVIAGRQELIDEIHDTRTTLGACMDPHAAWLLLRGIKTLAVRVERQNENALRVARFLDGHPKVRRVNYPFLEGHPQHRLAKEQMSGGGGLLSFEVDGTGHDARRVVESLRLFTLAPSLGGVDSLVTIPILTSHGMISSAERQKIGVGEQLIRLSVGIENADDLITDLEQGLSTLVAAPPQAEMARS